MMETYLNIWTLFKTKCIFVIRPHGILRLGLSISAGYSFFAVLWSLLLMKEINEPESIAPHSDICRIVFQTGIISMIFSLKQRYMKKKYFFTRVTQVSYCCGLVGRSSSIERHALFVVRWHRLLKKYWVDIYQKTRFHGQCDRPQFTCTCNKNIFFLKLHDILLIVCTTCFIAFIVHHSIYNTDRSSLIDLNNQTNIFWKYMSARK